MSGVEVRVSPDGRVAILFTQAIRVCAGQEGEQKRHWCSFSWPETSSLTMHPLADSDVEDWQVVYYSEGVQAP